MALFQLPTFSGVYSPIKAAAHSTTPGTINLADIAKRGNGSNCIMSRAAWFNIADFKTVANKWGVYFAPCRLTRTPPYYTAAGVSSA